MVPLLWGHYSHYLPQNLCSWTYLLLSSSDSGPLRFYLASFPLSFSGCEKSQVFDLVSGIL
jgi:hypothetical protein